MADDDERREGLMWAALEDAVGIAPCAYCAMLGHEFAQCDQMREDDSLLDGEDRLSDRDDAIRRAPL